MKKNYIIALGLGIALYSCNTITSSLEKKINKSNEKVGLRQPSRSNRSDESKDSIPSFITFINDKGVEQIISKSTVDEKTGENITTVDLAGVTVVAKSKNISERNGKVNIDFIVTVPSILINNKWQLQITPELYKNKNIIELDRIFLSGADFLKYQAKGYKMYQNFIASIIPDSAYMQKFFNEKGFRKAMSDLEQEFYQSWKRDQLSEMQFIDWKDKRNRRYLLFNKIMENNKQTIAGRKSWKSTLPSYWLRREVDQTVVPSTWVNFLDPNYKIDRKQISSEDSIEISKKYFDFDRMRDNERKKELKDEIYNKYVRFPYQPAKLDTIIDKGDKFEYYYTQEVSADEAIKKLLLTLNGNVIAIDESQYKLPPSDTLTFYISSMVQFLDRTPHYKTHIVSKHAQANMTAYVNFHKGKSDIDLEIPGNKEEIEKIMDAVYKLTFSGELVMDSIKMLASSSPEGSSSLNFLLSQKRANSLKTFLVRNLKDSEDASLFRPKSIGEDWGKLRKLIEQSDELNDKKEILDIISNERNLDNREKKIKDIYPVDYAYIEKKLYPDMRAVNFEFYLHRRDMVKDTIHTTIIDSDYMHALDDMENRNYKKALTVLNEYEDYNTGICLMSLGYDKKAFEVLKKQKESSNREYLLAILAMRLKDHQNAVKFFMRSVELDETKIYRGKLDPEINELINTYNLKFDEQNY